jgi:hypothetical protein
VAGAAGWQANAWSLEAYDAAGLACASDARGPAPFLPRAGGKTFRTPQIPTTLPTLDELLGRPEYPLEDLARHYIGWLGRRRTNVLTIHAEIEGMARLDWWRGFLARTATFVKCRTLGEVTASLAPSALPVCDLVQRSVDGRSGTLAVQAALSAS